MFLKLETREGCRGRKLTEIGCTHSLSLSGFPSLSSSLLLSLAHFISRSFFRSLAKCDSPSLSLSHPFVASFTQMNTQSNLHSFKPTVSNSKGERKKERKRKREREREQFTALSLLFCLSSASETRNSRIYSHFVNG